MKISDYIIYGWPGFFLLKDLTHVEFCFLVKICWPQVLVQTTETTDQVHKSKMKQNEIWRIKLHGRLY